MRKLLFLFFITFSSLSYSQTNIGNIINLYREVLSFDPCNNGILLNSTTGYNLGDTVLLVQMKGAVIDTSNSANFGSLINYGNTGNYEFNYVAGKSGNLLFLKNKITRNYDIPLGKVQLIRVPYYNSAIVTSTLTSQAWNGTTGGILAFNVKDSLKLNSNIDVTGKGFQPGIAVDQNHPSNFFCFENNFFYPSTVQYLADIKGDGIAIVQSNKSFGKGAPANAGGGGNSHNAGGGGGGNAALGGFGGYQFENCVPPPFDNRGIGGRPLIYSNANQKIFMGGSGGSGHANNGIFFPNGGAGGGIVIITTTYLRANSFKIIGNGNPGFGCTLGPADCHEGMGGGGAGGTILIKNLNYQDNLSIQTLGGKGADMVAGSIYGKVGPGGGGSGGLLWISQATIPTSINYANSGGTNGVCTNYSNDVWGSTPGAPGASLTGLQIMLDTILFKKNIDSVRIKDSVLNCSSFFFSARPYLNNNPTVTYAWDFGDGNISNQQNIAHTYNVTGTYVVRLFVTDVLGCKDSSKINVTTQTLPFADAGLDTAFCKGIGSVTVNLRAASAPSYAWTPANYLNDSTLQSPTATISTTTKFYLLVRSASGCSSIDSVTVTVNSLPEVKTIPDTTICLSSNLTLATSGAATYQWQPVIYLNDPGIASPTFNGPTNYTYYVTGTSTNGCQAKDTVNITVKPLPLIRTIADTGICKSDSIILSSSGGQIYSWAPTNNLNNSNVASPTFTGNSNQVYIVTGVGPNGCSAKDTVAITVKDLPNIKTINDTAICSGQQLSLATTGGLNYVWTPNTNLVFTNVSSPTFIGLNSQTFTVAGNGSNGCIGRDTVDITINPNPLIRSIPDSSICANETIILSTTGAQSYSWNATPSLNNSNISSPTFSGLSDETLIVTGISFQGCTGRDTVNITIKTVPIVKTIADTITCSNQSIILTASGAQSYSWTPVTFLTNPNSSAPIFQGNQNQTYIVTGIAQNLCISKDTVSIVVNAPHLFKAPNSATLCKGSSVILKGNNGSTVAYNWSPNLFISNTQIEQPTVTPPSTMQYLLSVRDLVCRKDSVFNISVIVNPLPAITATKSNDIDCANTSTLLQATGGKIYTWSPSINLNFSNISNPIASPPQTTTYKVRGEDINGCENTDSVNVVVNITGKNSIYIATAFTPNGDQINDCFSPGNLFGSQKMDFSIYNRWGEKVFHSTDPSKCWNGYYKNVPSEPGVYVYYLTATTSCGEIIKKGVINLIR